MAHSPSSPNNFCKSERFTWELNVFTPIIGGVASLCALAQVMMEGVNA